MLKLKCQYFGPLRQRANSMEKTLMLGKIEGSKRRGQQKMRWLDSITNSTVMSFCKLQTIVKNWCFWTVVLEKTLESPFDCKEIKSVSPKGNQSWIFIGWTDAEVEAPILWPPDVKNWLTGKNLDAGKDWRQEEKGTTEDKMVGWYHWLTGHEFEQALGDGEGHGPLVHGVRESDTT